MRTKSKFIIILTVCLFLFSCAGAQLKKTSYFNWKVNIKKIKKIAVLPFKNYTKNKEMGKTLREIVIAEILANNIFDVVDPSITDLVLYEEGVDKNLKMDEATIRRIGKKLGVQALLIGSLTYLENVRNGSYVYPVIGISLRLIDVKTGDIIWECKGIKSGYNLWARLFGFPSKSAVELSFELIKEMLKDWGA